MHMEPEIDKTEGMSNNDTHGQDISQVGCRHPNGLMVASTASTLLAVKCRTLCAACSGTSGCPG